MASNDKTTTDDTLVKDGSQAPANAVAGQSVSADERRMHLQAFDYWRELKGDRDKPLFHQLTVDGLAPYKHYSLLVERGLLRDDGSTEISVRFFGPGLEPLFNRRPTAGDNFRDYTDSGFAEELLSLLDNRSAADRAAEFEYVDMHIDSRGVMLPLSRSGGTVDYLWVVISSKTYEEDEDGGTDTAADDLDTAASADRTANTASEMAGSGEQSMALQSLEGDAATTLDGNDLAGAADAVDGSDIEAASEVAQTNSTPDANNLSEDDIEALLGGPAHAEMDDSTLEAESSDDDWAALEQAPLQAAQPVQAEQDQERAPAQDEELQHLPEDDSVAGDGVGRDVSAQDVSNGAQAAIQADADASEQVGAASSTPLEADLSTAQAKAAEYQQGHQAGFGQLYSLLADAMALFEKAEADPNWWQATLEAAGLRAQKRAPYTPSLKMVFGKDYDKTRLTEYAAALSYAARMGQSSQTLVAFLSDLPGGIKGAVQAERSARRGQPGAVQSDRLSAARKTLAERPARATVPIALEDDFVLLLARKGEGGADIIQIADMSDSKLSAILQQLAQKDPA